jgi:hypothetical protein
MGKQNNKRLQHTLPVEDKEMRNDAELADTQRAKSECREKTNGRREFAGKDTT